MKRISARQKKRGSARSLIFCVSSTTQLSPQTLKLRGELYGIPIQVLVDSGASHNFISRTLVSTLSLPTRSFFCLNIRLGDGHWIRVQQKCESIDLKFCDFSCPLEALVFDLGNLDMVFGIEWLKNSG